MIREANVDRPLAFFFVIQSRIDERRARSGLNFECAMDISCEDLSAVSDNFLILLRNEKSKLD